MPRLIPPGSVPRSSQLARSFLAATKHVRLPDISPSAPSNRDRSRSTITSVQSGGAPPAGTAATVVEPRRVDADVDAISEAVVGACARQDSAAL